MHKITTTEKIIKIAKTVDKITKLTEGTPLLDVGAGVREGSSGSEFPKENNENKRKTNI